MAPVAVKKTQALALVVIVVLLPAAMALAAIASLSVSAADNGYAVISYAVVFFASAVLPLLPVAAALPCGEKGRKKGKKAKKCSNREKPSVAPAAESLCTRLCARLQDAEYALYDLVTTCLRVMQALTVAVLLAVLVYYIVVWDSGAAWETGATLMYLISTAHRVYLQPFFDSAARDTPAVVMYILTTAHTDYFLPFVDGFMTTTTTLVRLTNLTVCNATTTAAHTFDILAAHAATHASLATQCAIRLATAAGVHASTVAMAAAQVGVTGVPLVLDVLGYIPQVLLYTAVFDYGLEVACERVVKPIRKLVAVVAQAAKRIATACTVPALVYIVLFVLNSNMALDMMVRWTQDAVTRMVLLRVLSPDEWTALVRAAENGTSASGAEARGMSAVAKLINILSLPKVSSSSPTPPTPPRTSESEGPSTAPPSPPVANESHSSSSSASSSSNVGNVIRSGARTILGVRQAARRPPRVPRPTEVPPVLSAAAQYPRLGTEVTTSYFGGTFSVSSRMPFLVSLGSLSEAEALIYKYFAAMLARVNWEMTAFIGKGALGSVYLVCDETGIAVGAAKIALCDNATKYFLANWEASVLQATSYDGLSVPHLLNDGMYALSCSLPGGSVITGTMILMEYVGDGFISFEDFVHGWHADPANFIPLFNCFDVNEFLAVAIAVLKALTLLFLGFQSRGWVYRDAKPENLRIKYDVTETVTSSGIRRKKLNVQFKFIDLGAATKHGHTCAFNMGSPAYQSPEEIAANMTQTYQVAHTGNDVWSTLNLAFFLLRNTPLLLPTDALWFAALRRADTTYESWLAGLRPVLVTHYREAFMGLDRFHPGVARWPQVRDEILRALRVDPEHRRLPFSVIDPGVPTN